MSKTIISFEAKSIQNYLLDSSKLKDMIGASEQIENLCTQNGLLDEVLNALNLKPAFSRRAGGAFTAFFDNSEEGEHFYAVWSYCVQQQMPGLMFVQDKQNYEKDDEIKDTLEKQQRQLEQARNRLFVDYPVPGPLVMRSQRTGGAGSRTEEDGERNEILDKPTQCKREFEPQVLLHKIDAEEQFIWPDHFNEDEAPDPEKQFPTLSDNPYIAIIHADGNGLGNIVKTVIAGLKPEKLQATLNAFSKAIDDATCQATRSAINQSKLHKYLTNNYGTMPARPLIIGGDDLTFVVRGDLAIDFTVKYLENFESETKSVFTGLKKQYPEIKSLLPSHLTACAGIVFIRPKQPFHQAYSLVESLCKHAKNQAKDRKKKGNLNFVPSALAFHRVTTSLIDQYDTILERELTTEQNTVVSMQPYYLDAEPEISKLQNLADYFQDSRISRGAMRELLDLLHDDLNSAQQRFERWQTLLHQDAPELKDDIMHTLFSLTGGEEVSHPKLPGLLSQPNKQNENLSDSPLGDALALNSIRRGSDHDN